MSPKGEAGELKQASTAGVAVPASGAQGLLFTEDLPVLDEDAGYRGPTACKAAGITYRQLDYWARTGLVEPAVRGAAGSGSQRLYGFRDILVLKVVKRLLDTGVSLQQIQGAAHSIHHWPGDSAKNAAGLFDALLQNLLHPNGVAPAGTVRNRSLR